MNNIGAMMGFEQGSPWLFVLLVWTLFWKGLALWHAADRKQPWWFVIILVVSTVGILDIIYIFGVAKVKIGDLFKK